MSVTANRKRRRWVARTGLVCLLSALTAILWASNYFYQRAQILKLASDARIEPPPDWLVSVVGRSAVEMFGDPLQLSFPRDVKLTASQIRLIGGYDQLEHLTAYGLDDRDVRRLGNLTDLTELILPDSQISDEGLEVIGGFTNLQRLWIIADDESRHDGRITVDGVRELTNLTNLAEFTLQTPELDDASLEPLGHISTLTDLSVRSRNIHGDGLHDLSGLTALLYLDLSYCPIDRPGCLSDLQSMPALRSLFLQGTAITDERLTELVPLKALIQVEFCDTAVTHEAALELQSTLTSLKIYDSDFQLLPAPGPQTVSPNSGPAAESGIPAGSP